MRKERKELSEEIAGGVTAPKGFTAAGVHCGVKKSRKDLAILYSERPARCAALFTANRVAAAPVILDRELLTRSDLMRAVVVNSGNANACTGERGMRDAREMASAAAAALGVPAGQVLVSSTGVIGKYLPMESIRGGILEGAKALAPGGGADAAEAIMTTDTFVKQAAFRIEIDGTIVTLGGMAKGSGMIAPNMATMLAFVATDAAIDGPALRAMLKSAADRSFNRITVDGDTSTNDMVALFANGRAGNAEIRSADEGSGAVFLAALERLLVRLSKMIVTDGEGATKLIEIRVTGAASEEAAALAARAVANSNLVKTAIHGEDANWGRILAAVGYSGISFAPEEVEIFFDRVPILRRNYNIDFSEEEAARALAKKEVAITIRLNQGSASAVFWTCDLSKEYVAINANYRS